MPTIRKRIGYLPSAEVQKIINKICVRNNLSQSKVTGILVKEALQARNLYRLNNKEEIEEFDFNNDFYNTEATDKIDSITNKYENIAENQEYKLIKEYLNYKSFKKILSIVQSEN